MAFRARKFFGPFEKRTPGPGVRGNSGALARMTATRKTSLENKHLPNCEYFRFSHLVRIL